MRRLLIRAGGIGDCIVTFPAMQALATTDTEVWITPECRPLVSFAARTRSIAATGLHLLRVPGFASPDLETALASFDSVVSWYGRGHAAVQRELRRMSPGAHLLDSCPPPDCGVHAVDF